MKIITFTSIICIADTSWLMEAGKLSTNVIKKVLKHSNNIIFKIHFSVLK